MNALERKATSLSVALCRDAFGNLFSGQDERRAFGFLREAVGVLVALQQHAESKGDVRAEKSLKEAMERAISATDTLEPPFDGSRASAASEKWLALGITPEGVLVAPGATQ